MKPELPRGRAGDGVRDKPQVTIAGAAIAAGSPAISSSFRFHRPRGPMCGRGYCGQCECETKRGRVHACETPADLAAAHRRTPDPLRLAGKVAEQWPPWFYEHRFQSSEWLNKLSQDVMRRMSGAGSLGLLSAIPVPRDFLEEECEVVAVGDPSRAPDGARVLDQARGALAVGVYPDRVLGVLTKDALLALRFDRLVLATGAYDRLPPISGIDLPGVLGFKGLVRYAEMGVVRPGTRIAVCTPEAKQPQVQEFMLRHGLTTVWLSDVFPLSILGTKQVEGVIVADGRKLNCDLFVTAVEQPAIELGLQAGARAELTSGELPILTLAECPDWLTVVGAAAKRSSGVPDVSPDPDAIACMCEDIRVKDLREAVAQGFRQVELVKRRTGAMTGGCQGKVCAPTVLSVLRDEGLNVAPTTARPLSRPVTLGQLAANA